MKITDYADQMSGKNLFPALKKEPFRASEDFVKEILTESKKHFGYEHNIQACETPKAFYDNMPDLSNVIPKAAQVEAFYIMKTGQFCEYVPAIVFYALEKCKELGSFNYFTTLFTKRQLETLFAENSLGNEHSIRDVICTLYNKKFQPLTSHELVAYNSEGFSDVYIEATNMVAIVPNKIVERLSKDDIRSIEVVKKTLVLGDTPLYELGKYYGASNSTYDLRNLR